MHRMPSRACVGALTTVYLLTLKRALSWHLRSAWRTMQAAQQNELEAMTDMFNKCVHPCSNLPPTRGRSCSADCECEFCQTVLQDD